MSQSRLRVVIADDEPLALQRLRLAFRDIPDAEVVGEATNGLEALDLIAELKPDLAVLDIQMPGRTGLGVAAALPAERRPEIVFLTAYDSHALDAFDVEAADYVLKPLRLERLRQAVERARRRRGSATPLQAPTAPDASAGDDGFWIQGRQGLVHAPLARIEWIEAAKDYVLLHTPTRSHILRATMQSIEKRFPPPILVRVHRSALVRPGAVRRLDVSSAGRPALVLADDVAVPVGPSYLSASEAMFRAVSMP
jgi:DNA-binding LytR/AlgR family response regulator